MRYAVIGGGMAGLTAALELRARGHQVTVLERERVPGGKVRTERSGDWLVERGPIAVQDNAPGTQELIDQLSLGSSVLTADDAAKRRFVLLGGKLREVPESPPKLILSGTLSLAEKWRLLREPKAPKPDGSDETIRDFAVRRLGESIARRFVEPMVTGIFAGDYAKLSLRSVFPRLAELEREHGSLLRGLMATERARKAEGKPRVPTRLRTLAGGMGALPAAAAKSLGDALKLGVEVGLITRFGEGWTVSTEGGPVEVDRVILAVPPDAASRLVAPVDAAMAEAFDAIPQVGVVAVTLGYPRAAVKHPLVGFGFLAPRIEHERILGTLFMTSIFPSQSQAPPDHVALRVLIGGAHDPAALDLDDAALVEIARVGLHALVGADGAPAFTHVVRWPLAIPQYVTGHAGRVATVEERGARMGLYATGASMRGVGVNDVVREAKALVARLGA
jgi:oxygen-dependent protoporphyrinogen oxidase